MVRNKIRLLKPTEEKTFVYDTGLTQQQIDERQKKFKQECQARARKKTNLKYVWVHINNTTKGVYNGF